MVLDKTIPYFGVLMIKEDPWEYPRFTLPDGYNFCTYQDGFENHWAEIHFAVGQFDSIDKGKEYFKEEFLSSPDELFQKCIFVRNLEGSMVGTVSLWQGKHFGETLQRLHWLAVHPAHQGKGIAKALITKIFDIYNALGYKEFIYLTTQTWSYKAIKIYLDFGFKPYMGDKPVNWSGTYEDFEKNNVTAWKIIMDVLKK